METKVPVIPRLMMVGMEEVEVSYRWAAIYGKSNDVHFLDDWVIVTSDILDVNGACRELIQKASDLGRASTLGWILASPSPHCTTTIDQIMLNYNIPEPHPGEPIHPPSRMTEAHKGITKQEKKQ